jgi:hypothetical protein
MRLYRVRLLSHRLHTNTPLVGKKDKNLVAWIFVCCRKKVELVPTARQKNDEPGQDFPKRTGNKRTHSMLPI